MMFRFIPILTTTQNAMNAENVCVRTMEMTAVKCRALETFLFEIVPVILLSTGNFDLGS